MAGNIQPRNQLFRKKILLIVVDNPQERKRTLGAWDCTIVCRILVEDSGLSLEGCRHLHQERH